MFVIADGVYKTRTDRILQDISRKYPDVIIWSEDAIVVSLLPEPRCRSRGISIAGSLFRDTDEPPKIRPIGETFDQHMKVIRHQAVRNNRKLILSRCETKLLERLGGRSVIAKNRTTKMCGGCNEIAIRAGISKPDDAWRTRHGSYTEQLTYRACWIVGGPEGPP